MKILIETKLELENDEVMALYKYLGNSSVNDYKANEMDEKEQCLLSNIWSEMHVAFTKEQDK